MQTIDINIKKPLYGCRVFIRYEYIKQAIAEGKKLKITIPQGTAIVDPVQWMVTGTKMEKVFNFPDNPMLLYGNDLKLNLRTIKKEKKPSENQMALL